jgi:LmbE family N-acetylglucosaminyl deacetylase
MGSLPMVSSVLAVCAHPDDESFGLGATLAAFASRGTPTTVLCLTHGAASALGTRRGDLHQIRAAELTAAARKLGVGDVELLDYPDGALTHEPAELLSRHVHQAAVRANADLLLVFDESGITSHPDHRQATRAAVLFAQRARLPVLAWAVEQRVAATLNSEFGTSFVGRTTDQIDCSIEVDRQRQLSAITCHASQAQDNPVLWRRLELQGNREVFRWLNRVGRTGGPRHAPTADAAETGSRSRSAPHDRLRRQQRYAQRCAQNQILCTRTPAPPVELIDAPIRQPRGADRISGHSP